MLAVAQSFLLVIQEIEWRKKLSIFSHSRFVEMKIPKGMWCLSSCNQFQKYVLSNIHTRANGISTDLCEFWYVKANIFGYFSVCFSLALATILLLHLFGITWTHLHICSSFLWRAEFNVNNHTWASHQAKAHIKHKHKRAILIDSTGA